jgi:hypothetical protein
MNCVCLSLADSLFRFALVIAFLLAVPCLQAQAPERADDPLPDGAKVRFGVSRFVLRGNPGVALVPPACVNGPGPDSDREVKALWE